MQLLASPLRRLWLLSAALVACLPLGTMAAPLEVVATTTMITDMAKNVAGDRANVTGLMGPGVDPHLYKPSAGDVTRLRKARVILYNGLFLEGRMSDLFERMGKGGKTIVAIGTAVPVAELSKGEGEETHPDPHIWGDARLWSLCIAPVVKALSEADPAGAGEYARRGDAYAAELAKLHTWAIARAKEVPAAQRTLVTSHDAFNYFGRAYGFQVIGVQGISTVSEAGTADIVKVVDLIKQRALRAIFVESSVPRATIERIAQDSGAKVGGELYSDALGTPGAKATGGGETYDPGTYIGMLKHNVNTVVEALR